MKMEEKITYCVHLKDKAKKEKEDFNKAVSDDQWFLGEKEKHPIDRERAKEDFINNYFLNWAENEGRDFCKNCPDYNRCEPGKKLVKGS